MDRIGGTGTTNPNKTSNNDEWNVDGGMHSISERSSGCDLIVRHETWRTNGKVSEYKYTLSLEIQYSTGLLTLNYIKIINVMAIVSNEGFVTLHLREAYHRRRFSMNSENIGNSFSVNMHA